MIILCVLTRKWRKRISAIVLSWWSPSHSSCSIQSMQVQLIKTARIVHFDSNPNSYSKIVLYMQSTIGAHMKAICMVVKLSLLCSLGARRKFHGVALRCPTFMDNWLWTFFFCKIWKLLCIKKEKVIPQYHIERSMKNRTNILVTCRKKSLMGWRGRHYFSTRVPFPLWNNNGNTKVCAYRTWKGGKNEGVRSKVILRVRKPAAEHPPVHWQRLGKIYVISCKLKFAHKNFRS